MQFTKNQRREFIAVTMATKRCVSAAAAAAVESTLLSLVKSVKRIYVIGPHETCFFSLPLTNIADACS